MAIRACAPCEAGSESNTYRPIARTRDPRSSNGVLSGLLVLARAQCRRWLALRVVRSVRRTVATPHIRAGKSSRWPAKGLFDIEFGPSELVSAWQVPCLPSQLPYRCVKSKHRMGLMGPTTGYAQLLPRCRLGAESRSFRAYQFHTIYTVMDCCLGVFVFVERLDVVSDG